MPISFPPVRVPHHEVHEEGEALFVAKITDSHRFS
jgi:hypothetical protein